MPDDSSPFLKLDASDGPLSSTDLMRVVFEMRAREEQPSAELEAELIGLQLGTLREGESAWGTRYGPWSTITTEDGRHVEIPPRSQITGDVLKAWERRALAARHPFLRYRFADLVWDLAALAGRRRDVSFARLAIDSVLQGLAAGSFRYPVEGLKASNRALELARMINDPDRAVAVERAIFAYETSHGSDAHEATWGHALELVVQRKSKLPSTEQEDVVAAMEDRLTRLAAGDPHPHTVEAAVLPLAEVYKQRGRGDDVARVLRIYTRLVIAAGRKMQGMVAASFLDRLHAVLEQYGLRDDAAALAEEMQLQGRRSVSELKRFSTTVKIPAEEMQAVVNGVLLGTTEEALVRIAFYFVPDREKAVERVQALTVEAPLMADMPKAIIDANGQKLAMVGSVEDDLEGNLVQHIAQRLQIMAPYLRVTLDEAQRRIGLDAALVLAEARKSPVFDEDKLSLVEAGLRAYFAGQDAIAIHLLVPQVEAAIRRLAIISGVMPYKRKKDDLELRSLGSLLGDPQLEAVLDPRLALYLRILLTDVRGWNLRNQVCHGLFQAGQVGPVLADRVLHVILLLTRIRKHDPTESTGKPPPPTAPGA